MAFFNLNGLTLRSQPDKTRLDGIRARLYLVNHVNAFSIGAGTFVGSFQKNVYKFASLAVTRVYAAFDLAVLGKNTQAAPKNKPQCACKNSKTFHDEKLIKD